MEEEVNVHYKEMIIGKSHDQILTNQLQRLMMCFDVYLETETQSAEEGPKEISKEKVYARLNRLVIAYCLHLLPLSVNSHRILIWPMPSSFFCKCVCFTPSLIPVKTQVVTHF